MDEKLTLPFFSKKAPKKGAPAPTPAAAATATAATAASDKKDVKKPPAKKPSDSTGAGKE